MRILSIALACLLWAATVAAQPLATESVAEEAGISIMAAPQEETAAAQTEQQNGEADGTAAPAAAQGNAVNRWEYAKAEAAAQQAAEQAQPAGAELQTTAVSENSKPQKAAETETAAAENNGAKAQAAPKQEPQIIRKTVKLTPPQEKWRPTKPGDFTYCTNESHPQYSIALPYAFGEDLLAGLPAQGPMLVRGASDNVVMAFRSQTGGEAAKVFAQALAGKKELPPPAPVTKNITIPADPAKGTPEQHIIEITEFEAPPQYSYGQVDVTTLDLPAQLAELELVEAGEYNTFQGLCSSYMQFKCTSANVPCLLRLTLTEYNGCEYLGFYLFPQSRRLSFVPLAVYSARSLQCGGSSIMGK